MDIPMLPATDHDFKDRHEQGQRSFPIQYYVDELEKYPGKQIALHWHPELEFYMVRGCPLRLQIGQEELLLKEGDGIFLNANVLHAYYPAAEGASTHPNIVFSSELIASYDSASFSKYVQPILENQELPYILLKPDIPWQQNILSLLDHIFSLMQAYSAPSPYYGPFPLLPFCHLGVKSPCYELDVQTLLGQIWKQFLINWDKIPRIPTKKSSQILQVRMQKMLAFIHEHYSTQITITQIAAAAGISKSEASRCFERFLQKSPGRHLMDYRLESARKMLKQTNSSISEIAEQNGFDSASYFCKLFKREFGMTPMQFRAASAIHQDVHKITTKEYYYDH